MKQIMSILGVLALAVFTLSGCTQSSKVVRLQGLDESASKTYQRLLVFDISSDPGQQQQLEAALVKGLKAENVEASGGYPQLVSLKGVPRAQLEELAVEIGADGILVTSVTSVSSNIEIEEGREQLVSTCRRGDPIDYFLYDHEILKEPDAVKVAHTVVVLASLYDADTHERVWAIESTCFDKATLADALAAEAKVIVQQLVDEDVI